MRLTDLVILLRHIRNSYSSVYSLSRTILGENGLNRDPCTAESALSGLNADPQSPCGSNAVRGKSARVVCPHFSHHPRSDTLRSGIEATVDVYPYEKYSSDIYIQTLCRREM